MKTKIFSKLVMICLVTFFVTAVQGQIITTVAGVGGVGDGGSATNAILYNPYGVATDASGNLYIADAYNNRIRKVTTAGVITTIAGTGFSGYGGDGGPAVAAYLSNTFGVAVDLAGNVYIADEGNNRIRKVTAAGIISTFAGNGSFGYTGDGGAATAAELFNPNAVAVDGSGNVFIADFNNNVIRKVNTSGIISTIAGNGTPGFSGDGGNATSAELTNPAGVAIDASGNVFVADAANNRVRKITTAGIINTIAGNGTAGYSGDGGQATAAELFGTAGVFVDGSENVYIADQVNNRIRKVSPSGIISTIAGNGTAGYYGDGGQATAGEVDFPTGVSADGSGNLYIADFRNYTVRKVNTSGIISTIAGTTFLGDGGQATAALFYEISDVKTDASGNIYIADGGANLVRKINSSGIITTVAGNWLDGSSAVTGPATAVHLFGPNGIGLDASGNLYIAENYNVLLVNPAGIASIFAGNSYMTGFSGDGGQATNALLFTPEGVAFDAAGNVYIADGNNHRIRMVNSSGIINTIAGSTFGFSGDGGPASLAEMSLPTSLTFDTSGNLYIADLNNQRIRMINTSGIISTFAGNGTAGYGGDGGPASLAELNGSIGVWADINNNNIYIADWFNNRVRVVNSDGVINTFAGTGVAGYSGDGGQATAAELFGCNALGTDESGHTYIADQNNNRVRVVSPPATGIKNLPATPQSISLSINPNPNKGLFTLHLTALNQQFAPLTITDATGRQVKSLIINANMDTEIQMNVPPGVYLLTAYTSMGNITGKIVVE